MLQTIVDHFLKVAKTHNAAIWVVLGLLVWAVVKQNSPAMVGQLSLVLGVLYGTNAVIGGGVVPYIKNRWG